MRRTIALAALATVGFAIAQYEWPTYRARLAGGWFAVLGALALARLAGRIGGTYPQPPAARRPVPGWLRRGREAGRRIRLRVRPRAGDRPVTADLARMEGVVVEALATANGVHRRLRPLVREIVDDRLALAFGLHVDRDTTRVRQLVGEDLWELIRPDRPYPVDGFAPGLRPAQLAALVDSLESLESLASLGSIGGSR